MRLIKLAVISIVILFGIVTGISLFIPSHIRLTKVITIRPEKDSIFSLVKNKSEWVRWHPSFNGQQTEMLSRIEVKVVSENESLLLMQWRQAGKKNLNMGWQLMRSSNAIDPGTLQWFMEFKTSWYPWEKFGSLFYENNYGAMMEQGLVNIKNEVEK